MKSFQNAMMEAILADEKDVDKAIDSAVFIGVKECLDNDIHLGSIGRDENCNKRSSKFDGGAQ